MFSKLTGKGAPSGTLLNDIVIFITALVALLKALGVF